MKKVIEKRDSYRTMVYSSRKNTSLVRTPDNVLHIDIYEVPTSTWYLADDCFMCSHDNIEVEEFIEDNFGFDGHYQTSYEGYVCVECGEGVEGSPEEDRYENMVDTQIMDSLGK